MIEILLSLAVLVVPAVLVLGIGVFIGPRCSQHVVSSTAAAQRAKDLLEGLLSAEQREQLACKGFLCVGSRVYPGREYRVWASGRPVDVLEGGKLTVSLCVEPLEPLPPYDVVLMHKLLIEGDELRYLRIANELNGSGWARRRRLDGFWWT